MAGGLAGKKKAHRGDAEGAETRGGRERDLGSSTLGEPKPRRPSFWPFLRAPPRLRGAFELRRHRDFRHGRRGRTKANIVGRPGVPTLFPCAPKMDPMRTSRLVL